MPASDFTARNHSCHVRKTVPVGSQVRTITDCYCDGPVPAGSTGIVRSYTNAGFQGIIAWITLSDGREVYSLSAGNLEATDMPAKKELEQS